MLICLLVILSMFMMYELTILSVKDYFQCDAHLFAGTTKHVYDVRLTALSGKDHLLVYEALPAPKKKNF